MFMVSKPTSRRLWARGATFLITTPNLPPGDCQPVVQPVYMVSELTSRGLLARGAICL